jgi:hypothetical protein
MATVSIEPMPIAYRDVPARLRAMPPPIFSGEPSQADRELALALWRALDRESRRWYTYGGTARTFAGLVLTDDDIAALRNE